LHKAWQNANNVEAWQDGKIAIAWQDANNMKA
jgi:hypothetical protein